MSLPMFHNNSLKKCDDYYCKVNRLMMIVQLSEGLLIRENVVDKVITELKNTSLNESVLEEPETKPDNSVPPGD